MVLLEPQAAIGYDLQIPNYHPAKMSDMLPHNQTRLLSYQLVEAIAPHTLTVLGTFHPYIESQLKL